MKYYKVEYTDGSCSQLYDDANRMVKEYCLGFKEKRVKVIWIIIPKEIKREFINVDTSTSSIMNNPTRLEKWFGKTFNMMFKASKQKLK